MYCKYNRKYTVIPVDQATQSFKTVPSNIGENKAVVQYIQATIYGAAKHETIV